MKIEQSCYLFLWRRTELLGLFGSEGCRHVECQHHLIVAEALVFLKTGHKVIGEGYQCLDTMAHLAVAQVLQHVAHLHTHAHTHSGEPSNFTCGTNVKSFGFASVSQSQECWWGRHGRAIHHSKYCWVQLTVSSICSLQFYLQLLTLMFGWKPHGGHLETSLSVFGVFESNTTFLKL